MSLATQYWHDVHINRTMKKDGGCTRAQLHGLSLTKSYLTSVTAWLAICQQQNQCWVMTETPSPKETKQAFGEKLNTLGPFHSFFSDSNRQTFWLYVTFFCLQSLYRASARTTILELEECPNHNMRSHIRAIRPGEKWEWACAMEFPWLFITFQTKLWVS